MGTDDYFLNRDETPIDENGEKDYESIRAVDTRLFVSNLKDLLAGEKVDLPTFDFIEGIKKYGQRITKIGRHQVIVIEGIHALNRLLTEGIDDSEKFKIYISPFTPISIDRHNRIPTTDCRLLRRMVRDYQFRGWPVKRTLSSWPKVRSGEDQNIFPYNGEADVFFKSNCIYELAVLKKYAEPLLQEVKPADEEYGEALRLLEFLRFSEEASDDDSIANNSIIREFIGGSVIVH
jgi:uridine kinase